MQVAVQAPGEPAFWFLAADETRAVGMVELLRQGAFAIPVNPTPWPADCDQPPLL